MAVRTSTSGSTRIGMLSTYPPTQCGLATFNAALWRELDRPAGTAEVVRVVDRPETHPADEVVAHLVNGSPDSARAAVRRLDSYDAVVVQHEYGIYGGPDGVDVLGVVEALSVPTIVVLHTVLTHPTPGQRHVLRRLLAAADVVVTMTATARDRLLDGYDASPEQVVVIPHGAVDHAQVATLPQQRHRPLVLTWGLLGPGKGIEWAVDALPALRDLRPRYRVVGRTHPKVFERDGDAYRDGLQEQAERLGVADLLELDDSYLSVADLTHLVAQADVVLLPYDSVDQVTSGVLTEAVAAGRPVVSTGFPHARELLPGGPGLVVPQGDAPAIAAALRRVLTEPGLATSMAAASARRAPELYWSAVADRYRALADGLVTAALAEVCVTVPQPSYAHLRHLTDPGGLYEHALGTTPRPEHGYCVDDVARGLVVLGRLPAGDQDDLLVGYLDFVLAAQAPDGRFRNRRSAELAWLDEPTVEDCWGRALWGLGTVVAHRPDLRGTALAAFERGAALRSPHSRARAFAALGAAEVLTVHPGSTVARVLLARTAYGISTSTNGAWPWPEPRLTYADAVLPEVLLAAGRALGDAELLQHGLRLLGWLLTRSTRSGHLSVTPVGGAGPLEVRSGDQQPIEVAALADACARAAALTGDPRWDAGLALAVGWFLGDNDAGVPMLDATSGGGCDGLEAHGRNENQGAESTLALLSTLQRGRGVALAPA